MASKNINYLGINLAENMEDQYTENYIIVTREINKEPNN